MNAAPQFGSRRGNAIVEFGLSAPLILAVLVGIFQFGYTFYVYNTLQLAVRGGVRYGSVMNYSGATPACDASMQDKVSSLIVYGTPTPADGAVPVVRGLSKSNVNVDFHPDEKGVPGEVTVSITAFQVDALFTKFTFNGKPFASVPYAGRYSPSECN
jgi:Flp pilus assembly protein TadG